MHRQTLAIRGPSITFSAQHAGSRMPTGPPDPRASAPRAKAATACLALCAVALAVTVPVASCCSTARQRHVTGRSPPPGQAGRQKHSCPKCRSSSRRCSPLQKGNPTGRCGTGNRGGAQEPHRPFERAAGRGQAERARTRDGARARRTVESACGGNEGCCRACPQSRRHADGAAGGARHTAEGVRRHG